MTIVEHIDHQEVELFALLSALTCAEVISPKERETIDLRYGAAMDRAENDPQAQLAIVGELKHQLELLNALHCNMPALSIR